MSFLVPALLEWALPIRSKTQLPSRQRRRQKKLASKYGTPPNHHGTPLTANERRAIDKPGLLLKSSEAELTSAQTCFARDDAEWEGKDHSDLLSVIKEVKPHVLIGTSTKPGSFTEEVVKEMAKHVERPIIFPLSNPTRLHEAKPEDIFKWTEGKALIATGSPFDPVEWEGIKYEVGKLSPNPPSTQYHVCHDNMGLFICFRVRDNVVSLGG